MTLTFGSLFDGIYGFGLGLESAGFTCEWRSEIDANCNKLMEAHRPNITNLGDVKNVNKDNARAVNLICGGFPCQDLSVAGKRAGLAGERSGLWFEYHRVLAELRPEWCVIENVPGLLSSNRGRDFAIILRGLVELGYGVCWRVLDAQYFGVPQRRRRVFIVGHLGDGRSAEVLFERDSGEGDFETGRKAGEEVAYALRSNPSRSGDKGDGGINTTLTAWDHQTKRIHSAEGLAPTISGSDGGGGQRIPYVANAISAKWAKGTGGPSGDEVQNLVAPTLERGYAEKRYSNQQFFSQNGDGFPVTTGGVRRLTPTECERLQGFPDGWTGAFADSVRYKMLGNAVAVPVIAWLAKRIAEVAAR